MAVHEACQVWIEQRIQEELEQRGDTEKSFRAIGRELAAEIERMFEAKVSEELVEKQKTADQVADGGTNGDQ